MEGGVFFDFKALLDTGSSGSLISPDVSERLQAIPAGTGTYQTASGDIFSTDIYKVLVNIVVNTKLKQTREHQMHLTVLELPKIQPDFDVVLGMDVLSNFRITIQGDLLIAHI